MKRTMELIEEIENDLLDVRVKMLNLAKKLNESYADDENNIHLMELHIIEFKDLKKELSNLLKIIG